MSDCSMWAGLIPWWEFILVAWAVGIGTGILTSILCSPLRHTNDPNATEESGSKTSPPLASREEGASGAVAPDHRMATLDATATLSNQGGCGCRHCNLARAYLTRTADLESEQRAWRDEFTRRHETECENEVLLKAMGAAALEFERRMDEHADSYNKHDFGDGQWLAYRNAAAWIHDASDAITGEGRQWLNRTGDPSHERK